MELKTSAESNIKDIDFLAVAIGSPIPPMLHMGFFYKTSPESEVRFCHFANHLHLIDEEAKDKTKYKWLESDLRRVVKKHIVAYIYLIVKNKDVRPVPYSYVRQGLSFDIHTGEYIREAPGEGLTCATFILDVISLKAKKVLDEKTWLPRREDEEWKQQILDMLRNSNADKNHIASMESAKNIIRFRPEEVAMGYHLPSKSWPLPFEDVEMPAQELKQALS